MRPPPEIGSIYERVNILFPSDDVGCYKSWQRCIESNRCHKVLDLGLQRKHKTIKNSTMVKVVDAKRDEDQVDEYHGTKVGNILVLKKSITTKWSSL